MEVESTENKNTWKWITFNAKNCNSNTLFLMMSSPHSRKLELSKHELPNKNLQQNVKGKT